MKRISSRPRMGFAQASLCLPGLAVLLAFTPGIANAWFYGSYEGVHYSPYALSYYRSGLVPGNVQYSPYAFSYYNSGLVQDYGIYPGYCDTFLVPVPRFHRGFRAPAVHRAPPAVRRHAQVPSGPSPKPDGTGPRLPRQEPAWGIPPHPRGNPCRDPLEVIRWHLRGKGFASASIDRILRVDNKIVSVDFLVKDRDVLIKYWNPQELERLDAQEDYQQKMCAKYKEDWERYAQQYRQTGGEIYTIRASEPETIVAALDACTRLSPDLAAPAPQAIYAKE